MRAVFTQRAKGDLREIALFIARDNPTRAQSFVGELRIKAKEITRNPLAFPLLERFKSRGVRRIVFHNYLIFYRIDPDAVVILRILHGARDYEQIV